MLLETTNDYPLVSIVIPCYNQGAFLLEAIESVRNQGYPCKEIIVVDDGSVDHTQDVARRFEEVRYIYQSNKGLSSARNTGIKNSTGVYLVFLDADDWLLPGALETNWAYLQKDSRLAFVSGGYKLSYVPEQKIWDVTREVPADHYLHLLQGNYIGMHAAVMFPRWALHGEPYDTKLKACEDYDLYLRLARDHPVQHHSALMAVYRVHTDNMSGNYVLMLKTALAVLRRQQSKLRSIDEKRAFKAGTVHFKKYYTNKIFDKLVYNIECEKDNNFQELLTLFQYNPSLYSKYLDQKRKIRRGRGQLFYQRIASKLRTFIK